MYMDSSYLASITMTKLRRVRIFGFYVDMNFGIRVKIHDSPFRVDNSRSAYEVQIKSHG